MYVSSISLWVLGRAFFSLESKSVSVKSHDPLSGDSPLWCGLCSAASNATATVSAPGAPTRHKPLVCSRFSPDPPAPLSTHQISLAVISTLQHVTPKSPCAPRMLVSCLTVPWSPQTHLTHTCSCLSPNLLLQAVRAGIQRRGSGSLGLTPGSAIFQPGDCGKVACSAPQLQNRDCSPGLWALEGFSGVTSDPGTE